MGDSAAIRQFFGCTLGIDVNPLVVRGCLGKLIDTILVNNHPFGETDFFVLQRLGVFHGFDYVQTEFL